MMANIFDQISDVRFINFRPVVHEACDTRVRPKTADRQNREGGVEAMTMVGMEG